MMREVEGKDGWDDKAAALHRLHFAASLTPQCSAFI